MKGIRDYFKKYQYQKYHWRRPLEFPPALCGFFSKRLHARLDFPTWLPRHHHLPPEHPPRKTTSAPSQTVSTSRELHQLLRRLTLSLPSTASFINGWTDDTRLPLPEVKDDMSYYYLRAGRSRFPRQASIILKNFLSSKNSASSSTGNSREDPRYPFRLASRLPPTLR